MKKMRGKRYSRDEIRQVRALVDEGLSNREIASKLGRSEAGIRNIRHRHRMKNKAKNETKSLLQKRDELKLQVSKLQERHQELLNTIEMLEKRKSKVETFLNLSRPVLQSVLTRALTKLKREKPDLFMLSGQEQKLFLVNRFLKILFS